MSDSDNDTSYEEHDLSRSQLYELFVPADDPSAEAPTLYFKFPDHANDGKTYGIDVSHHQGKIDWQSVKNAGPQFSYAKATQGKTLVDSRFDENIKGARNVGLRVGAYHFLSHGTTPKDQAANFINTYGPKREKNDLPPVLDLEWDIAPGGKQDRWAAQSPSKIVDKCVEWLKIVEDEFGVAPLIYTNKSWWEGRLGNEGKRLKGYGIWMSRYGRWDQPGPPMPDELSWALWQFTDKGTVSGVSGRVDVNFIASDFNFV
jgi:lysozyme